MKTVHKHRVIVETAKIQLSQLSKVSKNKLNVFLCSNVCLFFHFNFIIVVVIESEESENLHNQLPANPKSKLKAHTIYESHSKQQKDNNLQLEFEYLREFHNSYSIIG